MARPTRLLHLLALALALLTCGVAAAALVGDPPKAQPSRATVLASADVSLSRSTPAANTGHSRTLVAGPATQRRVLIRFDVPRLGGSWTGALRIYRLGNTSPIRVLRTAAGWDERRASWRSRPALSAATVGQARSGRRGWVQVPLRGTVGAGKLDLAVVLSCRSCSGRFASREAGRTRAPQLVLTQTATPMAPTANQQTETPTPPPTGTTTATTPTTPDTGPADSTAPTVAITLPHSGATVDANPTVTGSAGSATGDSATVTVRVYRGTDTTVTAVVTRTATTKSGSWSTGIGPLTSGTYTVQAEQDDAAGNQGFSGAVTFTVDATPPDTQIDSGPSGTIGVSSTSFSFSSEPGARFECELDTPSGDGTFGACSSARQFSGLADGRYTFAVRAIDAAGNVDPSPAMRAFSVNTHVPAAPSIASPADTSVTNQSPLTIAGTADPNVTVEVFDGATSLGTAGADGSRNWSLQAPLADGQHRLTAKASDNLGHTSPASAARSVTVDTQAPAPTVTGPSGDTDGQPTLSGTAGTATRDAARVSVEVHSGGSLAGPVAEVLSATVASDGSWSVKASPLLAIGSYVARVTQTDRAGNSGSGSRPSFTVEPTVAAAGDIACDPYSDPNYNGGNGVPDHCHMKATSDLLVNNGYHAVLPLGDNQYDNASLDRFQRSYDPTWGRVRPISHPVPGNHEYLNNTTATGYFDYFNGVGINTGAAGTRGQGWYSFDVGSWHVIALNSNCWTDPNNPAPVSCAAGSAQEQWLLADLAAHPNQCTLAYWHHPRFTSDTVVGSAAFMDQIWKDMVAGGVDLVVNGHAHGYERFAPMDATGAANQASGTREIVAATGGDDFQTYGPAKPASEVINNSTFGVLRLTLRPGAYDWRFVPEAGATFTDSGSTGCH